MNFHAGRGKFSTAGLWKNFKNTCIFNNYVLEYIMRAKTDFSTGSADRIVE